MQFIFAGEEKTESGGGGGVTVKGWCGVAGGGKWEVSRREVEGQV